jgi:nucleoside-diphosphate-sugar epimerase
MSAMDVLVIGGSRFMGRQLAHRLLARGDRVTLLNRGTLDDGLGDRVVRIVAHRTVSLDAVCDRSFDAVVDFAAYTGEDARRAIASLRTGHYVGISTGQVYLVRDGISYPASEDDYDGPVIARPDHPRGGANWDYGMGKRDFEDALSARPDFSSTRVRIPVVHGPGDPERRIERLVARLVDGEPVLVPRHDAVLRHVHAGEVAAILARLLGDARTIGRAFNVAPMETTTVLAFVRAIADRLGARTELVPVPFPALAAHGLEPEDVSPVGGRWSSVIDPSRVLRELDVLHPPVSAWLAGVVEHVVATRRGVPDDLVHRRTELEIARALG